MNVVIDEVILLNLKLAERLHNMRTVEVMDEKKRQEKSLETLEIYIPLRTKNRNEKLKSELNDLAVRYT